MALKIPPNAFSRLLQLKEIEVAAARRILAQDCYSDFFVEGSGPPWHEAFTDIISGKLFSTPKELLKLATGKTRMDYVAKFKKTTASADYCDFFVENNSDGQPWHEKCPADKFQKNYTLDERANMLRQSNVLGAYARLRASH